MISHYLKAYIHDFKMLFKKLDKEGHGTGSRKLISSYIIYIEEII